MRQGSILTWCKQNAFCKPPVCYGNAQEYQFNQRGDKTDILLQRYPVLLEECREACPGFGLSDFRFRLPSRIVEDGTVGKVYRYVVAFPRKEFESQVSSLPQEDCSRTKTIACLKQRCDSLHSTGKDDEIIRLWLRLALLRKHSRSQFSNLPSLSVDKLCGISSGYSRLVCRMGFCQRQAGGE